MATICLMGFEPGSMGVFDLLQAGSVITTNTRGAWSTYSYQATSTQSGRSLSQGTADFFFGFGVFKADYLSGFICDFLTVNGTVQIRLQFGTSKITVLRGTGSVLGTTATNLVGNVWHYIEGHIKIDDTVGTVEIKVDGVSDLSLTGQDTRNDAAAGGDKIDRWFIGGTSNTLFDDVYMNDIVTTPNDGYMGDIRVKGQVPTADGSNTGMTLSTGVNHFAVVDEIPPNTTDYAYGVGTTEIDTNNFPNTSGVGAVKAANLWLYAAKSDAGAANIAHVVKSGATTDTGADIALSTSYAYYNKIYNRDPNGPADWTAGAIDALEIGAKSR